MKQKPNTYSVAMNKLDAEKLVENFTTFECLIKLGQGLIKRRQYTATALIAHIAGMYAWHNHPGVFSSTRLEQLLLHLGYKALSPLSGLDDKASSLVPLHVLHVFTVAYGTGGHTRLAWRWIERDNTRKHSVVLTSQFVRGVPQQLRAAAENTGGKVYKLGSRDGSFIGRAKALRALGAKADLIILHSHPFDIIPMIAFANSTQRPPTVLMDHAEHLFWIGVGIADTVAHYRDAGLELAHWRRGLEPSRSALLPLPLILPERVFDRKAAKAQLGLPEDAIVLLSIASAYKYSPINDVSFVDVHVDVLHRHSQAILLVIGPTQTGEWAAAYNATGGRLRALGVLEDVRMHFQAADIYLDSFPLGGLTALLEAGSYGTPLVAYCLRPDGALLLCADDPAWPIEQVRIRSLRRYHEVLDQLICEPALRESQGARVRDSIIAMHSGEGWSDQLSRVYKHAATSPPARLPMLDDHAPSLGTIDQELNASQPYWMKQYRFGRGLHLANERFPLNFQAGVWISLFAWNFGREVFDLVKREMMPKLRRFWRRG